MKNRLLQVLCSTLLMLQLSVPLELSAQSTEGEKKEVWSSDSTFSSGHLLKVRTDRFTTTAADSTSHLSGPVQWRPLLTPLGFEYKKIPIEFLKYDTTPNNPAHKCYEYTRPLTKRVIFLFKFVSQQQYSTTLRQ